MIAKAIVWMVEEKWTFFALIWHHLVEGLILLGEVEELLI